MSDPIMLPLEWAVFEVSSTGAVYRVALVHEEDHARRIVRSLQRSAPSKWRYYVEPVAS